MSSGWACPQASSKPEGLGQSLTPPGWGFWARAERGVAGANGARSKQMAMEKGNALIGYSLGQSRVAVVRPPPGRESHRGELQADVVSATDRVVERRIGAPLRAGYSHCTLVRQVVDACADLEVVAQPIGAIKVVSVVR